MIKEDYVSFEIAKLLKEKGFKGQGEHFYEDNKITNYINYWFRITPEQRYEAIEAPTLQMAMKWLREIYDIFIEISVDEELNEHGYQWSLFDNTTKRIRPHAGWGDTYEQSCEAAIKYCLENLI